MKTFRDRCPRPDKLGFDTEEEARTRFSSLLATDQTMRLYVCRCSKWHAGRRDENVERNAIKSAPRISTGFNPAPPPATRARRRGTPGFRSSTVTCLKVDRRVWMAAKKLARGDDKRIQIVSATEVVVVNRAA